MSVNFISQLLKTKELSYCIVSLAPVLAVLSTWVVTNIASYFWYLQKLSGHGKVVLISGCDSGFGFMLAEDLSRKQGCTVLAGCYTEAGLKHWENNVGFGSEKGHNNVIPFSLDVTNESSIENAHKLVSLHAPHGLWAIVNNAGTVKGTLFELTPISVYKNLMDINFFGHVALTQKLLPFIKLAKGRIVNMSSIAGVFPIPNLSVYCSTKFAMYAWSHCIRRELSPYGISVSVVLPGYMKTSLLSEESFQARSAEIKTYVTKEKQEEFQQFFEGRQPSSVAVSLAENPQLVVDAYVHAILGKYPQSTYVVGKTGRSHYNLIKYYPEGLIDKLLEVKNLPVLKTLKH